MICLMSSVLVKIELFRVLIRKLIKPFLLKVQIMRIFALIFTFIAAFPVGAQAYDRISDRATFVDTVDGKDLRIGLYRLTLNVRADGSITGRAAGWDISGSWNWENGYFCREMDWSGTVIEYNCQLVEVNGDRIRFTVDQGAGDDAVLRIR